MPRLVCSGLGVKLDAWTSFPNPFVHGSCLASPSAQGFPLGWNLMMLGHHLLNVVATVLLARAVGLRTLHAAASGALVAATPLMLHEHAMGHTLTAAVWPGLLGLAALCAGRGAVAGLWIGIQGLTYLYTGLMVGVVALILRPGLVDYSWLSWSSRPTSCTSHRSWKPQVLSHHRTASRACRSTDSWAPPNSSTSGLFPWSCWVCWRFDSANIAPGLVVQCSLQPCSS